jgi:hypothetical protein
MSISQNSQPPAPTRSSRAPCGSAIDECATVRRGEVRDPPLRAAEDQRLEAPS